MGTQYSSGKTWNREEVDNTYVLYLPILPSYRKYKRSFWMASVSLNLNSSLEPRVYLNRHLYNIPNTSTFVWLEITHRSSIARYKTEVVLTNPVLFFPLHHNKIFVHFIMYVFVFPNCRYLHCWIQVAV